MSASERMSIRLLCRCLATMNSLLPGAFKNFNDDGLLVVLHSAEVNSGSHCCVSAAIFHTLLGWMESV